MASRLTFAGAIFLTVVAVLPPILTALMGVPALAAQFFGGTGLLIMVGVLLDVMRQVETHLIQRHYDGFLRKGRLRGRFGPAELIRHEREVRTDRHTVVRTEAARPDENAGRTGAEVAAPPPPGLRPSRDLARARPWRSAGLRRRCSSSSAWTRPSRPGSSPT